MDNFEIINMNTEYEVEIKILCDNKNDLNVMPTNDIKMTIDNDYLKSNHSNNEHTINMSTVATEIYNLVKINTSDKVYEKLLKRDISNKTVRKREINVTNKMITRAYNILNEIIRATNEKNIMRIIFYVCEITNKEYLKTWRDKQMLALMIMYRYIVEYIEDDMKQQTYLFVETHIPIMIEQLVHPQYRFLNMLKNKYNKRL